MAESTEQVDRPNLVSSRGFLQSARDLGLTTADAVSELVDNSFDAGANSVDVWVRPEGQFLRIRLLDDGCGIPPTVRADDGRLKDGIAFALSFGGRVPGGSAGVTIGKFGWGLSSAACCQSLRTEVYTKQRGEATTRFNYLDLEALESSNTILLPATVLASPSGELVEKLEAYNSGTLIDLCKCDSPDYKRPERMADSLSTHLGMKYRRFLEAGRVIRVNGELLLPRDPLFMTPGGFDADKIPLAAPYAEIDPITVSDVRDKLGQPAKIAIKVVCLDVGKIRRMKEWSPKWMRDRGLTEENQGFYLMRNDRQIAEAQTLGLFTRNASLNYFRGEISFPPSLDRYFGIQTNKNRFTLKEAVKERIEKALGPVIAQITNETRSIIDEIHSENELRAAETQGPSPAEKIAAEAANLLKVRPGSVGEETKRELERLEADARRELARIEADSSLDPEERSREVQLVRVRFETAKLPYRVLFDVLGDGNFFDSKFRGKQAQVIVNREHPFFHVYERATQSPEQRILLDLLLQSAVQAEGMYIDNPAMIASIGQFRREWSISLKVFIDKMEELSRAENETLEPVSEG